MPNPFKSALDWVAAHFRKDASKMLICTGVAGWTLSSLAQISAVLFNPKLSKEQKSFLVPQEISDAAVNIGLFFLITLATQLTVAKLFSTGKLAPQKVRKHLEKNKDIFQKKVGKVDFDLDEVLKKDDLFPREEYWACKNFTTTMATVGAGIVSSNIITPIVRNNMASKIQKQYISQKDKPVYNTPQISTNAYKSSGLRI